VRFFDPVISKSFKLNAELIENINQIFCIWSGSILRPVFDALNFDAHFTHKTAVCEGRPAVSKYLAELIDHTAQVKPGQ